MVVTSKISHSPSQPVWSSFFAQPGEPFERQELPLLQGTLPQGLRGRLFRNGPGRIERGGQTMGHWFDGDGGILGLYFTDAGVEAQYRYVETPYLLAETAANALIYPGYGTLAAGQLWQRWGKPAKNAANTSVLPLGDRLLALWEAGQPYGLNAETLETLGLVDLGFKHTSDTFSAHCKIEPYSGEIYNFGLTYGPKAIFQLYRCSPQGKILQQRQFSVPGLRGLPMVHDFVLAGDYLVFCIPPVRLQLLPSLLGLKTVSDALQWRPELGTKIVIVNRHTLEVISSSEQGPWFQWHFTNGYVDSHGELTIELVRFPDFASNQQFAEIPQGSIQTYTKGTLWRYRFEPSTAKLLDANELWGHSCEFPLCLDSEVGQPWRKTYLGIHQAPEDTGSELINGLAVYDHTTGQTTPAHFGLGCYPSEPIPVQNPANPAQQWVLTVVSNALEEISELRVYDGDRLDGEPICTYGLPTMVPPSFHGRWQPAL